MNRRIVELLPSYYWPKNAEVILLECDHRHIRPKGFVKVGGQFDCCFCDDMKTRGIAAGSRRRREHPMTEKGAPMKPLVMRSDLDRQKK